MTTTGTPDPARSTCSICGCASTWSDAFKPVRDGARNFLCCPRCAPRSIAKRRNTGLFVLLFVGAFSITSLGSPGESGLALPLIAYVLFVLFTFLLVPFHELGHAIAAKLVGAPAYAVTIGGEPWILDRQFADVRWRIGKVFGGGLTYSAPCEGRSVRLRKIVILLGGPAMNVAIAIVAWAIGRSLSRVSDGPLPVLALYVLAGASVIQCVTNLWPRKYASSVGQIDSDGAKILALLRGAPLDGRLAHAVMHGMRASFAFKDRNFPRAASEAALADAYLDAPGMRDARVSMTVTRAAALAESDDAPATVALLEPLLGAEGLNPGVRSGVEENLAWAYLLLDQSALAERARTLVASARAIAPWVTTYAVAQACILAAFPDPERQRVGQAHEQLKSIGRERLDRQNAAYTALARGLCAAAEGNTEEALRQRDRARALGATAAPLRVLERRIPSH